jgi:hypothetical protein
MDITLARHSQLPRALLKAWEAMINWWEAEQRVRAALAREREATDETVAASLAEYDLRDSRDARARVRAHKRVSDANVREANATAELARVLARRETFLIRMLYVRLSWLLIVALGGAAFKGFSFAFSKIADFLKAAGK